MNGELMVKRKKAIEEEMIQCKNRLEELKKKHTSTLTQTPSPHPLEEEQIDLVSLIKAKEKKDLDRMTNRLNIAKIAIDEYLHTHFQDIRKELASMAKEGLKRRWVFHVPYVYHPIFTWEKRWTLTGDEIESIIREILRSLNHDVKTKISPNAYLEIEKRNDAYGWIRIRGNIYD